MPSEALALKSQQESLSPDEARLYDEADVARMFNLPGGRSYVLEKCREQDWPHLKFSARVIRFADEDIEAIKQIVRVTPKQATDSPATPAAPAGGEVVRPTFNRAPKRHSRKAGM